MTNIKSEKSSKLIADLQASLGKAIKQQLEAHHELTWMIDSADVLSVFTAVKKAGFDMLIDLCAIDYLAYGQSEWMTDQATGRGFSRGVSRDARDLGVAPKPYDTHRFAVVYHVLSLSHNERVRIKVMLKEEDLIVDSIVSIYPAANWFEREAFDLYGVVFDGHPDLRRILTDYGFAGHPFRKDFPISGHVEMRYDAAHERVVYEPVEIEPRVLVPKVIRHDLRYDNPRSPKQDKQED